jgi:L-fuculose-phosphate aldolase
MAERLYTGTSGNVSCRTGEGFLVTPSGLPCDELGPADLVEVGLDGASRGRWQPSTEWRIHRDLYRARPEIGAVVHTHSTFATALACLRRSVPAFHYMIAKTGGPELRCARYATYGTEALSRNVLAALAGRQACLLANHGLVAVAPELGAARRLAGEVELLSAQYLFARAAGRPVVLSAREMTVVAKKFAGYGPRRREATG